MIKTRSDLWSDLFFFLVAEHVSVPKKRDPAVTHGNGTYEKRERLRVPLREEVISAFSCSRIPLQQKKARHVIGGLWGKSETGN